MPYPFNEWPIVATIAMFIPLIVALAYSSLTTQDIVLVPVEAKTHGENNSAPGGNAKH